MEKIKTVVKGILVAAALLLIIGCDTGGSSAGEETITAETPGAGDDQTTTKKDSANESPTNTEKPGTGEEPPITEKPSAGEETTVYAIGDTGPAGGLIFYIDSADVHPWTYLEVAPVSTEWADKDWGGYGTNVGGAGQVAIGTGAKNTIDIVSEFGEAEPYLNYRDYAAKLCSDLVSGGYSDWFLPSFDELTAIWTNLVDNGSGTNNGVGGFAARSYWSSSESDSNNVIVVDFKAGKIHIYYKQNGAYTRVRAIRAF